MIDYMTLCLKRFYIVGSGLLHNMTRFHNGITWVVRFSSVPGFRHARVNNPNDDAEVNY